MCKDIEQYLKDVQQIKNDDVRDIMTLSLENRLKTLLEIIDVRTHDIADKEAGISRYLSAGEIITKEKAIDLFGKEISNDQIAKLLPLTKRLLCEQIEIIDDYVYKEELRINRNIETIIDIKDSGIMSDNIFIEDSAKNNIIKKVTTADKMLSGGLCKDTLFFIKEMKELEDGVNKEICNYNAIVILKSFIDDITRFQLLMMKKLNFIEMILSCIKKAENIIKEGNVFSEEDISVSIKKRKESLE